MVILVIIMVIRAPMASLFWDDVDMIFSYLNAQLINTRCPAEPLLASEATLPQCRPQAVMRHSQSFESAA